MALERFCVGAGQRNKGSGPALVSRDRQAVLVRAAAANATDGCSGELPAQKYVIRRCS